MTELGFPQAVLQGVRVPRSLLPFTFLARMNVTVLCAAMQLASAGHTVCVKTVDLKRGEVDAMRVYNNQQSELYVYVDTLPFQEPLLS